MTTIGSTNPYYAASLLGISGKNGGDRNGNGGGNEQAALPRQAMSGGMTGSDTVFGAKLADALWSMESQGVAIDQQAGDTWLGDKPDTSIADQFMELSKKTFAERIRDQYLEEHGLTEDSLAAMSPEDREAVESEIRKAILEAMGVNGDKQDVTMAMGGDPASEGQGAGVQAVGEASGKDGQQNGQEDPLFSM